MKILGSLVFLNPTETLTSRLLCKHFLSTAFKFTSFQDHLVPVNLKETLSKVDLTAFQSNSEDTTHLWTFFSIITPIK